MSDPQPAQLGRFRIVGELGRGAMGVVYKAEDPVLDRTVAIKVIFLTADLAERAEYEARFLQEAKAAGRLSHPAIITIYDVGRDGDLAYMAMELLQGNDLRSRISAGRLPVRQALDIAAQVVDALGFAHEHGVVHRDMKPANIMLVRGERPKIMDFGIARLRISDIKTQTGMLLGTPKYMSPEQVASRPVDHRSDLFSMGTVLYEMLTGAAPFTGLDSTQIMLNVATAVPVPPSRLNPEVPPMLDLVVAKALQKDPAARYQSAQEFAADLHACVAELADHLADVAAAAADATLNLPRVPTPPESGGLTERLATDAAGTARPGVAPAAAVGAERTVMTADSPARMPLSRRFDSSKAFARLAAPEDRTLLARAPRPPHPLLRAWRDREKRRMLGAILVSALLAAAIVLV